MSTLGRLQSIHRYPVKSMLGDTLESTTLGELGIPGDRAWGVRDEARGDFMTGKRVAALMSCHAGYVDSLPRGAPEIALPDGSRLRADDPDASKRISEALGREVTIWPIDPAAHGKDPEAALEDFDADAESRAMMAREGDEPMPDFSQLPAEILEFMGRPQRPYFDASPLLLLSEQSVAAIAKAAVDSEIDVRRFRPSLVIDAPGAGEFPEQAWLGRRLRIGETILAVTMACSRCVMTTHGFADLPEDPRIMRKLVSEAEGDLGVYALVERGGAVTVGDSVELLDPAD
jgi:uncharacterized protein YcbX